MEKLAMISKRKSILSRGLLSMVCEHIICLQKIPYHIMKEINVVTAQKRTPVKRNMNGENGHHDYHVFSERFFVSLEGKAFKNIRQLSKKFERETMDILNNDQKLMEDRLERMIAQMMPYLADPNYEVPGRAKTSSVVIQKLRDNDPFLAVTDRDICKIVERRRDAIKNARETELNKIVKYNQSLLENILLAKNTKKAVKKVRVNYSKNV